MVRPSSTPTSSFCSSDFSSLSLSLSLSLSFAGYELKVEKVLGSSCVCVDQAVCGEGAEGERKDISLYERSFGKDE